MAAADPPRHRPLPNQMSFLDPEDAGPRAQTPASNKPAKSRILMDNTTKIVDTERVEIHGSRDGRIHVEGDRFDWSIPHGGPEAGPGYLCLSDGTVVIVVNVEPEVWTLEVLVEGAAKNRVLRFEDREGCTTDIVRLEGAIRWIGYTKALKHAAQRRRQPRGAQPCPSPDSSAGTTTDSASGDSISSRMSIEPAFSPSASS